MKFIQLINESRSKVLKLEEAIAIVNRYCSVYLSDQRRIRMYRGKPNADALFALTDTKATKRKNADRFYNQIVDSLDSWKSFPRRAYCLSTATQASYAAMYGTGSSYCVIPFDNAKLGVCPTDDFIYSFLYLKNRYKNYDLLEIPRLFLMLLNSPKSTMDRESFVKEVLSLDTKRVYEMYQEIDTRNLDVRMNVDMFIDDLRGYRTVKDFFEKVFSPHYNDFTSFQNYSQFIKHKLKSQHEVYIEGNVLLIQTGVYPEFVKFFR